MIPARMVAGLAITFVATRLWGDGGVLLLRHNTETIRVMVFGAPVPLRLGGAEFSLLVQNTADGEPTLDAQVNLLLSQAGQPEVAIAATRARATNKLFYAAQTVLPHDGKWRLDVDVRSKGQQLRISGEFVVLPAEAPQATNWPYLGLPVAAVLLFLLNQRLKRRARESKAFF